MKSNYISRIIIKTNKPSLLIAAIAGCLIGFFLIIASIQNYFNFDYIITDKSQAIGSQFLIVNKKVTVFNSLDLNKSAFTEDQIKEIKTLPSVEKISVFTPNQYEAEAYLQLSVGDARAELKTDLFLESVEDDFIDVNSSEWQWKPGDQIVPVILPTDFINLYNFTYAPARGLPQISKATAGLFGFKIIINTKDGEKIFKGKIIGFSNRITSMIVPSSFMKYSNQEYANKENNDPRFYRLIVEVKPSHLHSFQQFLGAKGFETNEELLKSGRFLSLLHIILTVVFILGLLLVLNAFSGFILYLQLIITRSKYELETLLRLGYRHKKLTVRYAYGIGLILLIIFLLSFSILYFTQAKTNQLVADFGFQFPTSINPLVFIGGILIMLLLYVIFFFSIKKQIYNLALPKRNGKT